MATGADDDSAPYPRKVLLGHNTYQWPGGEDTAVDLDEQLLIDHGHETVRYQRDNRELIGIGPVGKARLVGRTMWAFDTQRELGELMRRERPEVAHFQNSFPLISPSAYAACRRAGVAVVQTMQNYRLVCPSAFLFRDGRVCEDCVGRRLAWPGILHACYHDSRTETAVSAAMHAVHRAAGTWSRRVDVFITVSQFGRDKLVEGGLPADRVVVRPNFTYPDPGSRPPGTVGDYALFVGRLSPEKGLHVLLDAFASLPDVPLKIVGDGLMRPELEEKVGRLRLGHVEFLGQRDRDAVLALMRGARFMVFPSQWYEHFPFVLVEAFASGLAVVASDLGAMIETVEDGVMGLRFTPGDPVHLAERARWAWEHPAEMAAMGEAARRAFESRYSARQGYELLVGAYREAIDRARARRAA